MAHPVLMPSAGQSMTEGRIVVWLKKEGERVKRGEPLLEIETDKANLEVEALAEGVLRKIFHEEGETVAVLTVIAVIGAADEEIDFEAVRAAGGEESRDGGASGDGDEGNKATSAGTTPAAAPESAAPPATGSGPAPASASAHGPTAPKADTAVAAPSGRNGGGSSPLARRLAAERGVSLGAVRGSGPGGRVLRRDVEAAAARGSGSFERPGSATGAYPPATPRPADRVALTGMRGAIASALSASKQAIPHFYATIAIDLGAALALKDALAASGTRVSVNDLIARATVLALADEPAVNCRVSAEHIDYPRDVNLGIAVGSDEGLVVPVVLRAEEHDLARLAGETRRVIESARRGKLVGMGQGTFTISNLGMFGVESFTAIINPPEGAILAVGATRDEFVAASGGLVPRPILRVTLSSDHRAIDGVLAARFLSRVKWILEDATRL